jgi:hypothetical protein
MTAQVHVSILLLAALAVFQDPGPWRLVFRHDGTKLHSIREDGTDRRAETQIFHTGVLSPDGTRRVFTREDGDFEVWVSDADGGKAQKLTDNKAHDSGPDWTPDGRRIVFYSNREGTSQIWIMDAEGGNPKRLTDHETGARNPRVSKTGVIAYEEIHVPTREKLPPVTLRTLDLAGGDSKVILERVQMLGHSWSDSGDRLAVSLIQELRILDPAGKTVTSIELAKMNKDLYAHAAFGMVWKPDGKAIACRIVFLGGRTEGASIFGDDQIFILPLEGKPVVIEAGGPASPLRWIR